MTAKAAAAAETNSPAERERQRVAHLVLGQPRPTRRLTQGKRSGVRKPVVRDVPLALDPAIEPAMQLRERWSHKRHATPETLEYAAGEIRREGSVARLWRDKQIDDDQLAAAAEIIAVAERVGADVTVKAASYAPRGDRRRHNDLSDERIEHVWREIAYTRWRTMLRGNAAAVLDMIVGDIGYTIVARRYRMHNRRAKQLLIDALDRWPREFHQARRAVDDATLAAAHAGILG